MLLRLLLFAFAFLCASAGAAEKFGSYAEPDFPVLTSTVDFSGWEKEGFPKGNLAVRGLIIKLPHDLYVCFDQDLLRVAGIWQGEPGGKFLTFTSIASISYNVESRKSEPGQKALPRPIGKPLMATALQPGWVLKPVEKITPGDFADPRRAGPDPAEPGRGPLPVESFRWEGYRLRGDGISLYYHCGNRLVEETFRSGITGDRPFVGRQIRFFPETSKLTEVLLGLQEPVSANLGRTVVMANAPFNGLPAASGVVKEAGLFADPFSSLWNLTYTFAGSPLTAEAVDSAKTAVIGWSNESWQQGVAVKPQPPVASGALSVEPVSLPVPNPWQRNVRPSGIAFDPKGTAWICTIDGDLWTVTGLGNPGGKVEWHRAASGLHEPQSVVCREGSIFVFTRDGIVRPPAGALSIPGLYLNFCNAFSQTGETREYPLDMVAKPGGGFYVVKGGQEITRKSPQGGRLLEVSADGRKVTEIATGLRQAYLGINPNTGVLTASDQQGHWVPSTPVHRIRPEAHAYFGFEEAAPVPVPSVIQEPVCWIPHEVNQSAAGQVWCVNAKMGPLNDRLLHLTYFRPGILIAMLDDEANQGAVIPSGLKFDFPLLKGAINPVDGLLYVCGFRIWGTESKDMAGFARVRPNGQAPAMPAVVSANASGIHLRFADKLDAATCKPENFAAGRWNYKRTPNYGSAHYKLDGTPGMEPLPCTGVQISADGCGLLIHLPDMKPVQQLRLDWHLRSASGTPLDSFACLTLRGVPPIDPAAAGFDPAYKPGPVPDLAALSAAKTEPTAEAGKLLVNQLGCLACHSTDGHMEGMKGPTWKDLFGSENELTTGKKVLADAAYLRESILNPAAKTRKGFNNGDVGMPPYAGILSDSQVESVVLYLRSLSNR